MREAWKSLRPDELWRRMVGQVAVIGSSRPWENARGARASSEITWPELDALSFSAALDEVASRVQRFFAAHGIRYAGGCGQPRSPCVRPSRLARTRALGWPAAVLAAAARLSADGERIAFVRALFEQVASQGARDFPMDAGLLRDSIATDARVKTQLRLAGLDEPEWLETSSYEIVEQAILANVARPLGLEGVEVDRTMYQRAEENRATHERE